MKTLFNGLILSIIFSLPVFSQNKTGQDSTLNNLILPEGYKTSVYGEIPHYKKIGTGPYNMILIPGLGFDEEVFMDFAKSNKGNYTMYCITIPGYGNTSAPPVPDQGISFGDQPWNKGVQLGIIKLINQEKITNPIIVGHFTQGTQLALRMAIDYPDLIKRVIILGGPAKFLGVQNGKVLEYPLDKTIAYVDRVSAPSFYKTVTRNYWNDNNYLPLLYSKQGEIANGLWKQVASVPLPIIIRYLCEFHATDVTLEITKIKCPVLVLRPGFPEAILSEKSNPALNYIAPQFITSWESVSKSNPLVNVQDIPGAAVFLWKDQPEVTNNLIRQFVMTKWSEQPSTWRRVPESRI